MIVFAQEYNRMKNKTLLTFKMVRIDIYTLKKDNNFLKNT